MLWKIIKHETYPCGIYIATGGDICDACTGTHLRISQNRWERVNGWAGEVKEIMGGWEREDYGERF